MRRICLRYPGTVPPTILKKHSYQMVFKLVILPGHVAELMKLCSRGYKRKVAGIHMCKSTCLVSVYVAKVFTTFSAGEDMQLVWPAQWETEHSQAESTEFRSNTLTASTPVGGTPRTASILSAPWKKNQDQDPVRVSACTPRSKEWVLFL